MLLNAIDITDSVKVHEELRKSQEDFRSLVEQISDWVWQVDEELRFTYASPRVKELLGYSPNEVIGKSALGLMEPGFAQQLFDACPALRRHEPFQLFQNPMVHRDGTVVWVETSGEPIYDEEGNFRGYRGIDRDITERKRAEEALRTSEEQYKALFYNSPLPMWVFCLESLTFLAVNEAMLDHYGYTREELIGQSIMKIRPTEEEARLRESIKTALGEGYGPRGVWRHTKKDGTPIDVEVTTHTLTWQGNPALMVLANDITERLRAEEQLKKKTSS